MKLLTVAVMLAIADSAVAQPADHEGWISHPAAVPSSPQPVVLHFLREIRLDQRPAALPGEFVWKGKTYPLTQVRSRFVLN